MVSIGKLLDLNKTEAAEKLKALYLVTDNSISMVKTTDEDTLQNLRKEQGLKNFAKEYSRLKDLLSNDVNHPPLACGDDSHSSFYKLALMLLPY
jgi:hypothetical protein